MAESLRALVVENNVHMRTLLRALLASLGVKDITEASSGEEALQLLRDKGADMILTDLSMDDMDGIAFTRTVRQSAASPNPYVPIIMVTGHTERHLVEAARDAGVTEFLAKPITVHSLFLRISEIIERPRAYVRCEAYFGPDRRRRGDDVSAGPKRRKDDAEKIAVAS